jgi:hypothetical protein
MHFSIENSMQFLYITISNFKGLEIQGPTSSALAILARKIYRIANIWAYFLDLNLLKMMHFVIYVPPTFF